MSAGSGTVVQVGAPILSVAPPPESQNAGSPAVTVMSAIVIHDPSNPEEFQDTNSPDKGDW